MMINTERLMLAPFDMQYLPDYFNGFSEEITRFQWPDPFESMDDAKDMLEGFLHEMEQGETLFFSVLSKRGEFLGSVEVHGLSGECPEVGVWIAVPHQNKGYAYEALRAALCHASSKYGRHAFFYEADIRNAASMRLLRKFEQDYDIVAQQPERLLTDSGKELTLQGHILSEKQNICFFAGPEANLD